MAAAPPDEQRGAVVGSPAARDAVLALSAVVFCWLAHELFVRLAAPLVVEQSPFVQPLRFVPLHIAADWDSNYYRLNFDHYQYYAWPPLYTETLRLVARLLRPAGDAFLASALVVNALAQLALGWSLVRLVGVEEAARGGQASSLRRWLAPVLLLLWPLHNVFNAAYSESLFVALAAGCVLAWRLERFVVASLLVALAFLTRTAGLFLIAGLAADSLYRSWRDRSWFTARQLPGLVGIATVVGWQTWLRRVHGVDMESLQAPWIEELVRVHVTPGVEPRLWVAAQLLFVRVPDVLAVWLAIAVTVVALRRRRMLEAGWVGSYLASFALHVYRPFSVPRLLSIIFPLTNQLAEWCARKRWVAAVVVVLFAAVAFVEQTLLFAKRMGEP